MALLIGVLASLTGHGNLALLLMIWLTLGFGRRHAWVAPLAPAALVLPALSAPTILALDWRISRASYLAEALFSVGQAIVLVVGVRVLAARKNGRERAAPWHRAAWWGTAIAAFWASGEMLEITAGLRGHPESVLRPESRATEFPIELVDRPASPSWWFWLALGLLP